MDRRGDCQGAENDGAEAKDNRRAAQTRVGGQRVPLMRPGMPLSTSKRRDIGFVPAANSHRLSHFGIWSYVLLRGMGFALTVQIVVPPLC